MKMRRCAVLVLLALAALARPSAQGRVPLPTAGQPITIAAGGRQVRVSLVAGGLVGPWAIAFLPGGNDMLVTEMAGRLRVIRNGVLVPEPAWQVPPPGGRDVLHGVAVHPDFAQNRLVYLAHVKTGERGLTTALSRGRLEGDRLTDVQEIFVADAWEKATNAFGGGLRFGPDRMLYMTIGDRDSLVLSDDNSIRLRAQNLGDHVGTVLRLTDQGTVPPDNPFVGRADARPEIFTYGHRTGFGMAFHPDTRELWFIDIGPMGGDRLDILLPGRNYGWPLVSMGRNYTGSLVSEQPWFRPGIEMPRMFWVPVISPSSLTFYTGDRFPEWKGNILIGALSGQQLQRVVIRGPGRGGGGQAEQRIPMLTELGVRFRDVQQGPDGLLYVATEVRYGSGMPDGTVLRIEPAPVP
jgi:glucose/arabinose dehydrogenase